MTRSASVSLPNDIDRILGERGIGRHEGHVLNLALRDRHAVKRITVVIGQLEDAKQVNRLDAENTVDAEPLQMFLKELACFRKFEFATPHVESNLPKAGSAEQEPVVFVSHGSPSCRGQFRLVATNGPRNTLVSIRRFIARESFNLPVGHRSVPAFFELDQAGGAPEFPLRLLFNGNELDDWPACFRDNNLPLRSVLFRSA